MPRTRYSSVSHSQNPHQEEMYNFNMYGNQVEEPTLNELLGNIRQAVRETHVVPERLRRRIDSNLVHGTYANSDEETSTRDIRIRNVTNAHKRTPGQNSTQNQITRRRPNP